MAAHALLRRWAWRGALIGILCASASWLLARHGLARAAEEWLQDGSFSYRGKRPSAASIVLIGLDDPSLDELRKPTVFASPELAKVVRYLHAQKAAAIGIDIILSEGLDNAPNLNLQAEEFGKAVEEAGNVVLPEALVDHQWLMPMKLWHLKRLREEAPAQTDLGFVNITEDDRCIRRQKLMLGTGDQSEYSFGLALLAVSRWVQPANGTAGRMTAMMSLYAQDRISGEGKALLVFFSDCHRERLTKGDITITAKGCDPVGSAERLKPVEHKAVKVGLQELGPDARIGAAVFRNEPGKPVVPFTGTTVLTDRPSFSWQPAAKAVTYQVRLLKAGSNVQIWKVETKEPKLAYPEKEKPLQRGRKYVWRVSATTREKDYEGFADVVESEFFMATAKEAEELAKIKPLAESADLGDLLLAAVAYQANGCCAEELAVYERLAKRMPKEAGYHRALALLYDRAGKLDQAKVERQKGELGPSH